jgi:putative membrane protein
VNILYVKALHIIFVVTWFAGLFYIVRLFIYHAEADNAPAPEKEILQRQFKIMERRLMYGITWPSMILTWIFGVWLAITLYGAQFPGWLILKLGFVCGLTLYHFLCQRLMKAFQKDQIKYSSFALRLWNEVTTVFLFAIVFLVVLRDSSNWIWGVVGLVLISLVLFIAVRMYKKIRSRKA